MERLVICGENSLDACKMARFVSLRWFMSMRAFWGGLPVNGFNITEIGGWGAWDALGAWDRKEGESLTHIIHEMSRVRVREGAVVRLCKVMTNLSQQVGL